MTAAPAECRILTALLLAPMDARELARCLTLELPHTRRRLTYLREAGDIRLHGEIHPRVGHPSVRYALTIKGRIWAQGLMA